MISVFFWVAFGAVIGWIAAILQEEVAPQGISGYIFAGALGGLLGGFGGVLLSPPGQASTNTTAITFALFGATASVVLTGLARQSRSRE